MKLIAYTNERIEISKEDRAEYRNPRWWKGETERGFSHVFTDREDIAKAYEKDGVERYGKEKPKQEFVQEAVEAPVEDTKEEEQATDGHLINGVEIPSDWKTFGWPRRRSLAAKLTDAPVKNSAQANMIINAALEE